ncbi:hypothetical protein ACFQ7F_24835 [Streptomyces sp. NPDC056486]|uniref:hypothetical protein n=1 Tax=Streptomyces sp. NPDC056486 TaxID=3345835 RepID=UPI00369524C5
MADALSRGDASNVVLIGCHTFTALEDLPAVENNLAGLRNMLTDPEVWGVPKDRIAVLAQPSNADDVLGVVRQAADSASDTLVVYYAGHGLTDPLSWELYLALSGSRIGDILVHSALRFEYLRRVIRNSGAKKKVVLSVAGPCRLRWTAAPRTSLAKLSSKVPTSSRLLARRLWLSLSLGRSSLRLLVNCSAL